MVDRVIPHLKLPLSLDPNGGLSTLEQDSPEDVTQCVAVLLGTDLGERIEDPDYGIEAGLFEVATDIGAILDKVEEYEPRAEVELNPGEVTDLVRDILAEVRLNG